MTEQYEDLGGRPTVHTPGPSDCGRDCTRERYRHLDGHQCPWLNEDNDGRAIPCRCTPKDEAT